MSIAATSVSPTRRVEGKSGTPRIRTAAAARSTITGAPAMGLDAYVTVTVSCVFASQACTVAGAPSRIEKAPTAALSATSPAIVRSTGAFTGQASGGASARITSGPSAALTIRAASVWVAVRTTRRSSQARGAGTGAPVVSVTVTPTDPTRTSDVTPSTPGFWIRTVRSGTSTA